jgi:hypothetical protein
MVEMPEPFNRTVSAMAAAQLSLPLPLVLMRCVTCEREFAAERATRKTCSDKCRQKLYRDRRAGRYDGERTVTRTVAGTNAELLQSVARLYIPDGALVADVTFGRGVFWQKTGRRFAVVSSDIMTKADVLADCRQLPYRAQTFDAVVFDPPYVHDAHPRMVFNDRYRGAETQGRGFSVEDILELYQCGMTEAARILKSRGRLFVKGMDQVSNGRQYWLSHDLPDIADDLGMFQRDQFILVPTAPPSSNRWKRQIHARKSHSFLWVFERSR